MSGPSTPPRVIHLLGGLRAIDDQSGTISIQSTADHRIGQFQAPPYAQLYSSLGSLGLPPIGVEFLNPHSSQGVTAPDWQFASIPYGFKVRTERDFWAGVRHAANEDRRPDISELAGRITTYLDLLPIRILQLSNAYNRTLGSYLAGRTRDDDLFFGNTFKPYIDAAIHAFVADAASFRDLIAECVWKIVLGRTARLTKFSSFLAKAKDDPHPLIHSLITAGGEGGWLKQFTDLRNHITHVAPVDRGSAFHFCQRRSLKIAEREATVLHYPLLDADGSLPNEPSDIDFRDETVIRAALEKYKAFADRSIDALHYTWRTLSQLIDVLIEVRSRSQLRSKRPHFTDDDLVGEPVFE